MIEYSDRQGDWIETATGRRFYPHDIRPGDFRIEDIAHALSQVNRFTGHTRVPYSVAEHSVRVAALLVDHPVEIQREALLHDASEAYLNDIATPIKRLPEMAAYRELERRVQDAIQAQFGLPPGMSESVRQADLKLLVIEARSLLPSRGLHWDQSGLPKPMPTRLRPWLPKNARANFLTLFRQLES